MQTATFSRPTLPPLCPSPVKVKRETVERRLLGELRGQLLTGEAMAELQATVRELLKLHKREARGASADLRRRFDALGQEVLRLVDGIAATGVSPAIAARLRQAEAEQGAIGQQLGQIDADAEAPAELLEDVMARYRRLVLNLRDVLDGEEDRARVRAMLAELLGPVVIGADSDGKAWAEIEEPAERLVQAVGGSMGLVAGARPSTTHCRTFRHHA